MLVSIGNEKKCASDKLTTNPMSYTLFLNGSIKLGSSRIGARRLGGRVVGWQYGRGDR